MRPQNHTVISNQHQNQSMLNVIDNCKQIVREDRLWLRNILKNKNTADQQYTSGIIHIFQQCSRPLYKLHLFEKDMKTLQTKLRKYVTNVKKTIKQQNIMRMKEKRIQNQEQFCNNQRGGIRKQLSQFRNNDTHQMTFGESMSRGKNPSKSYNNIRTKPDLKKQNSSFNYPSNWRAKYFEKINSSKDKNNNKSISRSSNSQIDDTFKNQSSHSHSYQREYQFVHQPYDKYKQISNQANIHPIITNKNQYLAEMKQQIIEQVPSYREKDHQKQIFNRNNHIFGKQSIKQSSMKDYEYKNNKALKEQFQQYADPQALVFDDIKMCASEASEQKTKFLQQPIYKNYKFQENKIPYCQQVNYSNKKNQEFSKNLPVQKITIQQPNEGQIFTSPSLLEQCRKFLNTKKIDDFMNNTNNINIPVSNQKDTHKIDMLFNDTPKYNQSDKSVQESYKKEQLNSYDHQFKNYNDINDQFEVQDIQSQLPKQVYKDAYKQIHEKYSSQKHNNNEYSGEKYQSSTKKYNPSSIQDVLSYFFKDYPQSDMPVQQFTNMLYNLDVNIQKMLTPALYKSKVSFLDLPRLLKLNKGSTISKDIFAILDLDTTHKSFIGVSNIEIFLQNLQSAQVSNYEQIERCLWNVFEKANIQNINFNEDNTQGLTYWHFYYLQMKQDEDFHEICRILDDFEFEIEVENQQYN